MKYLEIGPAISGTSLDPSFTVTVDSVARQHVDVVATWGYDKLPFSENSFDLVYASHVLEHVPWFKTQDAIDDAVRVLKPGGHLELWVPDFDIIVKAYLSGTVSENWIPFNEEREIMKWVAGRLMCGTREDEESSWHRAVFNERYLISCFQKAGLKEIHRGIKQPMTQRVNHDAINLGILGTK